MLLFEIINLMSTSYDCHRYAHEKVNAKKMGPRLIKRITSLW